MKKALPEREALFLRTAPIEREPWLPCVRGAGTAIKDLNAVTEGLYRRPAIAFTLFNVYPFSFVTKRKVVKRQKKSFHPYPHAPA